MAKWAIMSQEEWIEKWGYTQADYDHAVADGEV
jgi:hypothetical protein